MLFDFLKSADLDISDIKLESSNPIDNSFFPDDMSDAIKDSLLRNLKGKEFIDVKTVHQTSSGKSVYFDMDDESDGTRKIFTFAEPWLDSLKHGNLEKYYLNGRYGALPLISSLEYAGGVL